MCAEDEGAPTDAMLFMRADMAAGSPDVHVDPALLFIIPAITIERLSGSGRIRKVTRFSSQVVNFHAYENPSAVMLDTNCSKTAVLCTKSA